MNKIIITLTLIILSFSIYGCGETEPTKTTGGNTPNTPNIPTPPYFPPEEKLIYDFICSNLFDAVVKQV